MNKHTRTTRIDPWLSSSLGAQQKHSRVPTPLQPQKNTCGVNPAGPRHFWELAEQPGPVVMPAPTRHFPKCQEISETPPKQMPRNAPLTPLSILQSSVSESNYFSIVSGGSWPVGFGGVAGGIRDGLMAGKTIEV